MAAAPDSYVTNSGGRVSAGRHTLPAWRRAIAPGTWGLVTGNTLSDVNPANDAEINPNHPASSPWAGASGQSGIISAWGGACYDKLADTLWLPLNGGHSDYWGNEPYRLDLRRDVTEWEMLRNPSGAVGNLITFNDSQEPSGVYSDGRRRAIHGYGKHVYVPGLGPMVSVQGNTCPNPNGPNDTLLLDVSNGEMSLVGTLANPGSTTSGGSATYDTSRGCVYWIGSGDGRLSYFDKSAMTWTTLFGGSNNGIWTTSKIVYIPTIDRIVHITSSGFFVFNPETGTKTTMVTTGSAGESFSGAGGCDWCDALGCLLYWQGGATSRATISTLTPPASNPDSGTWVLGTLDVSIGNTVTPTAAAANGTFGRFFVSDNLNCVMTLNSTSQQIYAFSLG